VNKDVRGTWLFDEAIALGIVEPLDLTRVILDIEKNPPDDSVKTGMRS